MRKLLLIPLVVAALLVAQGAVQEPVAAQAKKDVKKDTKDTKKATGVIEIGEGKDGKFRFFVRDADGKLLAMSGPGGFASVKEAQDSIDELRAIVASAKVANVGKKKDKDKDE
jgi:hypothetical protein